METPNKKEKRQPAKDKLYDLAMVESISGGDAYFIKKMVDLFIETVPQDVTELDNGMRSENWEQVSKMAHKLKSTIDSMGIRSIKEEIRFVEINAKQLEALGEMPVMVEKIKTVIDGCISQLQKDIK